MEGKKGEGGEKERERKRGRKEGKRSRKKEGYRKEQYKGKPKEVGEPKTCQFFNRLALSHNPKKIFLTRVPITPIFLVGIAKISSLVKFKRQKNLNNSICPFSQKKALFKISSCQIFS